MMDEWDKANPINLSFKHKLTNKEWLELLDYSYNCQMLIYTDDWKKVRW